MDVIRTERLQENAAQVGEFVLRECQALRSEFPLVGDVRGCGLFVGLELVRVSDSDQITRAAMRPATAEAQAIVTRMKSRHHILISADGPDTNVLKLKPPMVFSMQNGAEFIRGLRECLVWTAERAAAVADASAAGVVLHCNGTKEKVVAVAAEPLAMTH